MAKQGIKRGSAAHKARQAALIDRKEQMAKEQRDGGMIIAEQEIMLALIAMGFRAAQFYELQENLTEIRRQRHAEVLEEFRDDPQLWHFKETVDREFRAALPPVMQKSWEERFDFSRHTLGLRVGPADNVPEELDEYIKAYAAYKAERRMAKIKREQKGTEING